MHGTKIGVQMNKSCTKKNGSVKLAGWGDKTPKMDFTDYKKNMGFN
ncbi:MAG: hypothetical protein OIN90_17770 [Candidatus Methanoperedens sp.]|nr:hypothetical protein [Candidatus Methanoperedens sp.]